MTAYNMLITTVIYEILRIDVKYCTPRYGNGDLVTVCKYRRSEEEVKFFSETRCKRYYGD